MVHLSAFVKYQLASYRKPVLYYYGSLLAFFILLGGGGGGGSTAATELFAFILGLNSFKHSFLFSQANNVSRKTVYAGTALALIISAAVLTLLDTVLGLFSPVQFGLYSQIYPPAPGIGFLWTFVFLVLLGSAGWMVNMIYYRSNPTMKIAVSVAPVFVVWIAAFFNKQSDGRLFSSLAHSFARFFGFLGEVPNPNPAIVSYAVLIMAVWLINSLLMYRAPVKV